MRTFIAIDLEDSLKKTLAELVDKLRPMGRDIRWVTWQGMHLTLKFLGETSDQDVLKIKSALQALSQDRQPFSLVLRGTGAFPAGHRAPRVLWVGVLDNLALKIIQQDIESGMEKLGFAREDRAFHPHLTLGRVKVPFRLEALLQELQKYQERPFGEMEVTKFTFFQSILKPSGAEYHVLGEYRLG